MFGPIKSDDMHSCFKCSYQTTWNFQLNHHVQRKHGNVYRAEQFCATVEPEPFYCACCDYNSQYKFELYEHYKQVHYPKNENDEIAPFFEEFISYPCGYCKYESGSVLSLIKHRVFCETGAEDPLAGAVVESEQSVTLSDRKTTCKLKFKPMKRAADGHGYWLNSRQLISCSICSYQAKFNSQMKTHMLKHATNDEINWFQCDHCSYRAKHKFDLKKHMIQHAKDEEINWFPCEHCSYRAKHKSNWTMHMLKHASNQEITEWFQCTKCSYRGKHMQYLKRHMLRHAADDEIRWLQCDQCAYRAKNGTRLKEHKLQHAPDTDVNWFNCDYCSYQSKVKSNLTRHKSRHAEYKRVTSWRSCEYCPYQTKDKSNFRRHNMLVHNNTRMKPIV